ncbi:MAG: tyrosine-type recombinase/integrase [Bacteroidaceae bacterium]|nr:tyrosine-type recombinase/integrase [Bacteroidaceae bacterium]
MYIDQFTDYLRLERNYSERTVSSYRRDLVLFRQFLKDTDVELDLLTADRDTVRLWVVDMMDKGDATTTVNRKLSTLRSFYRYLRMKGILESSPVQGIKGPKNKKPLPQFVKESEMNELLDETDLGSGFIGVRNKTVIATFYETGMRMAELIGLDDRDIDFGTRTIKVTGKRDKQRFIPFGQDLENQLRSYIEARTQEFGQTTGAFFLSPKGERIPRHQVYLLVKDALTKVSAVAKKSPHVLRHTFATSMLNHDAELGAVKELLGHNSLQTTEIYVHTTFQELKEIYKQAHPRA